MRPVPFHLGWLSVAVLAAVLAYGSSRDMVIWVDSVKYASASEHLAAGEGLVNDVLHSWDRSINDNSVVLTAHPPMLSLLYASLGGVTSDRLWPSQVWNVLFHVVTSLSIWWLALRMVGPVAAWAAGLATAACYPLVWLSGVMMAEGCCTALGLLALVCLVHSRQATRAWPWWIAASAAAAGAFLARYAMVAVGAVLVWECIVILRRFGIRKTLVASVPLLLPMTLAVVGLWTFNYLATGTIRGYLQPEQDRTITQAIFDVVRTALFQFGIWLDLSKRAIAVALFLVVPTVMLLVRWFRSANRGGDLQASLAKGIELAPIVIIAYAFILTMAMKKYQPRVEERFLAPIAPLMILVVTLIVAAGWQALREMVTSVKIKTAASIVLAVMLAGQVAFVSWVTWDRTQQDIRGNRIRSVVADFTNLSTAQWVFEHAAPESLVVSNRAPAIVWHTSLSAMELPSEEWEPLSKNPPNMEKWLPDRMAQVGAKYLAIFADEAGLRAQWYGDHVAALSRRQEANAKLVKVFESKDGVVYELKK